MSINKEYLTVREFAKREGVSIPTIKRWIYAKDKKKIPVNKIKNKRGYYSIFIHYMYLSTKEKRELFLEECLSAPKEESNAMHDLKSWEKDNLNEKLPAIKKFLELIKCAPSGNKTKIQKLVAEAYDITPRTLRNWLKGYREAGEYGLVPGWNNGNRNKIFNKKDKRTIRDIYLVELGPSKTEAYEIFCHRLKKDNRQIPSYPHFCRFISDSWSESEQLLFRNKDEWDRLHRPYVNRDWDNLEVNEVWFGDAKQIDVATLVYYGQIFAHSFEDDPDLERLLYQLKHNSKRRKIPKFVWLTAWIDSRSRKYLSWILTATHDKWAIAQSFSWAVREHGVPKEIYIDRGKPYKSRMISGSRIESRKIKLFNNIDEPYVSGIMNDLGVSIFFASPRNAQEKIIEPNFGIFTERLSRLPGYRGHSIKTRPKKVDREIKSGNLLSIEELSKEIDRVINERNSRPHSSTGKTPNSFYENHSFEIPSQKLLDYLLLDVHICRVRNSGVIVDGLFYRNEDIWLYSGEKLEVRRDPRDLRRAVIIRGGEIFPAQLEIPAHFHAPVTLEHARTCKKIRKKINNYRKGITESVDFEPSDEVEIRERKIISPRKIVSLNKKEKIAHKAMKELGKKLEQNEEKPSEEVMATIREANNLILIEKREREEQEKARLEEIYKLFRDNLDEKIWARRIRNERENI